MYKSRVQSEFVTNPIKVSILDFDSSNKLFIKKLIIFIGLVPVKVKSELEKIGRIKDILSNKLDKNLQSSKYPQLKKFYGVNWVNRLGINCLFLDKSGGDSKEKNLADFDFDDFDIGDIDIGDIDIDEIKKIEKKEESSEAEAKEDKIEEDLSLAEDFDEYIEQVKPGETDIFNLDKTASRDKGVELEKSLSYAKRAKIQFVFDELKIYPFDKVSEFKLKLYATTGIPIYRQHVWIYSRINNVKRPLSYNILKSGIPVYAPIDVLLNKITDSRNKSDSDVQEIDLGFPNKRETGNTNPEIEGIPIDVTWYTDKNRIKIEANDEFTLMNYYYSSCGVTHFNLIDLQSILTEDKLNTLRPVFKNDIYQKELLYYSFILPYWPMLTVDVFNVYISSSGKGSKEIVEFFPELEPVISKVRKRFSLEYSITDQGAENSSKTRVFESSISHIQKNIKNAITSSIISMLKMGNSQESVIHLRNVFDYFELDKYIDYCKVVLLHGGKKVTMKKVFNKNPFVFSKDQLFDSSHITYDKIPIGSLLFRIKLDPGKTTQAIYFNLFQNGNYSIMSDWREELHYNFNDIYNVIESVVRPLINRINGMKSKVLYYENIGVPQINKTDIKFTEINLNLFWKSEMDSEQFDMLESITEEFQSAGIIRRTSDVINTDNILDYYFAKGMHVFDANRIEKVVSISNYYDYLSDSIVQQKWNNIFQKTRSLTFVRRLNDIKVEIIGIRKAEYDVFNFYIVLLFHMFATKCKKSADCRKKSSGIDSKLSTKTQSLEERRKRKTLSDNKEQDPELYNSRKKYSQTGVDFIYSRVCQKPYQPIMLSDSEYNNLDKEIKERSILYWNFTTQKPVYYLSLNPKYKYIKFITNKHPKGYCIPCAKKTEISDNPNDKKRIIHDVCLKTHKWEKEKKTITEKSRYIMSYGKHIEIGRLARLPDKTLEPIFYDSWSSTGAMDQECVSGITTGYYLYGVPQNLKNLSSVGYIFCLSNALKYDISKLFSECTKRIIAQPEKFKILLNGEITNYFSTYKHLLVSISLIEKGGSLSSIGLEQMGDKWNELFESIAFVYFYINTIKFEDTTMRGTELTDENINLVLPSRLNNAENFIYENYTNLITLKKVKNNTYNPVYHINTELFYRTRIINTRLFLSKSEIIQIILQIVQNRFKSLDPDSITLNILNRFLSSQKIWTLKSMYINKNNYCYYTLLTSNIGSKRDKVYIPVKTSLYAISKDVLTVYGPPNFTKCCNILKCLNTFIIQYNHWIAKESEKLGMYNPDIPKKYPLEQRVQPIIPYIELEKWIVNKNHVIGFTSQNLTFYMTPISISKANGISKKKKSFLYYRNDPYKVNCELYNKSPPMADRRVKNINSAIYNHYMYQFMLLEFVSLFGKRKNDPLRKKIKLLILKTNFNTQLDSFSVTLKELIDNTEDLKKISLFISNYLHGDKDKKNLINQINMVRFNFDVAIMRKLKNMDMPTLVKNLKTLSKKIITVAKEPSFLNTEGYEFDNAFVACSAAPKQDIRDMKQCKSKKLIIPKNKFDAYIEILASDILNPIKSNWIFSGIFSSKIMSYFKFTYRPFEYIDIEIS